MPFIFFPFKRVGGRCRQILYSFKAAGKLFLAKVESIILHTHGEMHFFYGHLWKDDRPEVFCAEPVSKLCEKATSGKFGTLLQQAFLSDCDKQKKREHHIDVRLVQALSLGKREKRTSFRLKWKRGSRRIMKYHRERQSQQNKFDSSHFLKAA